MDGSLVLPPHPVRTPIVEMNPTVMKVASLVCMLVGFFHTVDASDEMVMRG
jgi:hypothetical protein